MKLSFISFVLVVPLLLTACELTSLKPILDFEDAEKLFGDSFVAVAFSPDDRRYLNEKGQAFILEAIADKNHYEFDVEIETASTKLAASFHDAGSLPFDYIVQLIAPSGEASYAVGRKTEYGIAILNVRLTSSILEALKTLDIEPVRRRNGHAVETSSSLDGVIRVWADKERLADAGNDRFPMHYQVAQGEQAGAELKTQVMTQQCLAHAGHPLDPEVKRLPGRFAYGVALADIDVDAARKVCAVEGTSMPASARYALARAYLQAEEYEKVDAIVDALIDEDFALALVLRADQLMRGLGRAQDVAAGRRLLEDSEAAHPIIAQTLGDLHAYGRFGEPDFGAARLYYEKAERAGIAAASTSLGVLYAGGHGVEKHEVQAFRLFLKGAEGDDLRGRFESGYALYFGNGVEVDREAAYGHMLAAAEADHVEAQYFVGFMLSRGQGVDKSAREAWKWFERASVGGNANASAELGFMTYHGEGVVADEEKGLSLLRDAAAKGSGAAEGYLASLRGASLPPFDSNVPSEVRADVMALGGDDPFSFNRVNLPFMAGMAQYLTRTCNLPSDAGDRLELAALGAQGMSSLLGGNDYSNPDLGAALRNTMTSNALLAAGIKFAEQIPCQSALASHMAARLADASRSNKGRSGGSPFIASCAPTFGETRCSCLAQLGRGVIPDIYQQTYHRGIIREIINRNPIMALTIGVSCQISNY